MVFITFEGLDGSGKTTQSTLLYQYLKEHNYSSILTKEIGGTTVGDVVKDLLISQSMSKISEIFMIMGSRAHHVDSLIAPNLQDKIVICDRFLDSTLAYQCDKNEIDNIYKLHLDYIKILPTITFYIDIEYEMFVNRIANRAINNKWDFLSEAQFLKIRSNYLFLAEKFSSRITVINGNQDPKDIFQTIVEKLVFAKIILL
jgi:dTMP kinase